MSSLTTENTEHDESHHARRQAVSINVAQPEVVESTPVEPSLVRASDIFKIFLDNEYVTEVTAEQLERVKMSK